jgi:hypothetical protein
LDVITRTTVYSKRLRVDYDLDENEIRLALIAHAKKHFVYVEADGPWEFDWCDLEDGSLHATVTQRTEQESSEPEIVTR